MSDLRGLIPPMVTPMRDGAIDVKSIRSLVDFVAPHLDGLCICSSTGEAASLSLDERKQLVTSYLDALAGRKPLVVGLSDTAAPVTEDLVRFCEDLPVAAYLVPLPYYFRHTGQSIHAYFKWIASLTGRPIVLYDNPYSTKTTLSASLLASLVESVPTIEYIKLTDVDIDKPIELGQLSGVKLIAGSDEVMDHHIRRGCIGVICATPQVFPAESRRWFDALTTGDEGAAFRAKTAFASFIGEVMVGVDEYPATIKYALWKKGVIASPEVRRPLQALSDLRHREIVGSIELAAQASVR